MAYLVIRPLEMLRQPRFIGSAHISNSEFRTVTLVQDDTYAAVIYFGLH